MVLERMNEELSKHDRHRFDPYLRPFGNPRVVVPVSIVIMIIGALLSHWFQDWSWFSRMGSLVAVAGLLLTMSPMFSRGIYMSQAQAFGFAEEAEEGKSQVTRPEDRRIGNTVFVGVILAILGALIGAFGDLIA